MKKIPLTKGYYAVVDDRDFDKVNNFSWSVKSLSLKKPYATRSGDQVQMAHMILDVPEGFVPDHIDGNSLDNRRSNLRILTKLKNHQHQASWKKGDGFKGVQKDKKTDRYSSRICANGVYYWIGMFDTAQEAADAYDKKALEVFGDFAYLNRNKHLYVNPMSFYDPELDTANGYKKIHLPDNKIKILKDNYGKVSVYKLAKMLGLCYNKVKFTAQHYGLIREPMYVHKETGKKYTTVLEIHHDFPEYKPNTIWRLVKKNEFPVGKLYDFDRQKRY